MTSPQALELFHEGKLQEALTAATNEVRQNPTDGVARTLLAQLLCFTGDIERVDRQLNALGDQEPAAALAATMFQHLLRAAQAREQFYGEGRLPEFVAPPSPCLRLHLEASILLRENKGEEAASLAQAEELRPNLKGECDGQAFEGIRDTDDLTASFFEVLASNGKYYWIAMELVEKIEFQPPRRPIDLLWRPARLNVRSGPTGEVFFPALYVGAHAETDNALRLGRLTEWRGSPPAVVRGVGQRTFLVGDEGRPIMDMKTLTFQTTETP